LVLLIAMGCREHPEAIDAATATVAPSEEAPAKRVMYPSAPGSFVGIVDKAKGGVVAIRAGAPVKSGPAAMFPGAPDSVADVALGTGFLVENKGVYVITNDHIAAAAPELHVVLGDGTEMPAKVIGRDTRLDLALLSFEPPANQPPLVALPLGDSDDLQVGEWLVVLGDPFGDEVTASVGVVSATGRRAAASLLLGAAMTYRMFIQTDARIHRGNSGGPVLDSAGQVVGIAVATSDRSGELSFAIPIDRVREVFDALREHGRVARAWLGAWVKPVTTDVATMLALPKPRGAYITEIKPGSPAARAGLRTGDVLLRWGDRDVDDRSLPWLVSATPIGRPIPVVVWRTKAELPVSVVVEKMPE
jgi:serine protease Do